MYIILVASSHTKVLYHKLDIIFDPALNRMYTKASELRLH